MWAFIRWINNEILLYSIGKYTQYPVINHDGKDFEKECIYIYIYTHTHTYIYICNWITWLYCSNSHNVVNHLHFNFFLKRVFLWTTFCLVCCMMVWIIVLFVKTGIVGSAVNMGVGRWGLGCGQGSQLLTCYPLGHPWHVERAAGCFHLELKSVESKAKHCIKKQRHHFADKGPF